MVTKGICPFAEFIPGVTTYQPNNISRVGFCDHIAAGYMTTLRDISFWNNAKISSHFAIGKKGSIIQLVNIFDTAWAEGILNYPITWPPYSQMRNETGAISPNNWLISTEHEGFPGEVWTPQMLDSDIKVKQWCIAETRQYGYDSLRFGLDSLAGHYMFDPINRPNCPGSTWPRQQIYDSLPGDKMNRFNTVATSLQGSTQKQINLTEFDKTPPSSILRIELYLKYGSFIVLDSSGSYAGQVGWDGSRYGTVDVDASDGYFTLQGNGTLAQIGVVGYW